MLFGVRAPVVDAAARRKVHPHAGLRHYGVYGHQFGVFQPQLLTAGRNLAVIFSALPQNRKLQVQDTWHNPSLAMDLTDFWLGFGEGP
jgi:hypothetical protein